MEAGAVNIGMNEHDHKLLQLLTSDDLAQRALGGQLCAGLRGKYGFAVKQALQRLGVWFCLEYNVEPSFLQKTQHLFLAPNLCKLSTLPKGIQWLVNLNGLDLNNHLLEQLPKEIKLLQNLRKLYLRNNQLSDLPSEIGCLHKLYKLDLSWNKLVKLPPDIGNLVNLQVLKLSGNSLTNIPPSIEKTGKPEMFIVRLQSIGRVTRRGQPIVSIEDIEFD